MLWLAGLLCLFCLVCQITGADVQSVDVDPVLKKEQPDF